MFYSPEKNSIVPQKQEVLRYLGYLRSSPVDDVTDALIDSCISEMQSVISPKAVYEIFDLSISGEEIKFADVVIKSKDLARNLGAIYKGDGSLDRQLGSSNEVASLGRQFGGDNRVSPLDRQFEGACSKITLIAATIGMQSDALIKKTTKLDTAKAAVMQATGAMFIEEVVENAVAEIKKIAKVEGFSVRPRYSPGYGDVPLMVQKDFFRLLPCAKIGLSLMDTLIMAPEKSVTAFVGWC